MTKLITKKLIFPVQIDSRSCPKCGSTYLDRVPRRVIDRMIGIAMLLRRYHCSSCGWEGNLKFDRL